MMGVLAVAVALAIVGVGVVMWGLYVVLVPATGQAGASFIIGDGIVAVAVVLTAVARHLAP